MVEEVSKVKPSNRGELEIVDLHNFYLEKGELRTTLLQGGWFDAGKPDALLEASNYVKENELNTHFHSIIESALQKSQKRFKSMAKKILQ